MHHNNPKTQLKEMNMWLQMFWNSFMNLQEMKEWALSIEGCCPTITF